MSELADHAYLDREPGPFVALPTELLEDERIGPYEVLTYGAIAVFADRKTGVDRVAWPSQAKIAKLAHQSTRRVGQSVKALQETGWMTVERRRYANGLLAQLTYLLRWTSVSQTHIQGHQVPNHQHHVLDQPAPRAEQDRDPMTESHRPRENGRAAAERIPYDQILGYLNAATGKSLKVTTEGYRKLIRTIWRKLPSLGVESDEGRVRAFASVTDVKCTQWLGDPKMAHNCRPSTLWRSFERFEQYLNENESYLAWARGQAE